MSILSDTERSFAAAFSRMVYCNPFTPERIEHERDALQAEFVGAHRVWNLAPQDAGDGQNLITLGKRAEVLIRTVRQRLLDGQRASPSDLDLYQDLAYYWLYDACRERIQTMILEAESGSATQPVKWYRQYAADFDHFLKLGVPGLESKYEMAHAFACFFQIRRAFHFTFHFIVGSSTAAARLRKAAWESVFTRDMHQYLRLLYRRMADFTTLIVGPSGTGKELVARAIGFSRYIPFNVKTLTFAEDFTGSFHALNLPALSPTLIESELFGHRRGAFTGALADRAGWLEVCRPLGTVFLDEVGEIDAAIQVKLLRVLQTRTFQRLGDTQTRTFGGKIMAATNRDLATEMRRGHIREDFYYRLCSDMIRTPALREIIEESPDELRNLTLFIAQRVTEPKGEKVDPDQLALAHKEAESLADEVVRWVNKELGRTYPWPGNFRELEQCVRNILVRKEYRPAMLPGKGARQDLAQAVASGSLTVDQLLRRYCTVVQAQTMNYEETARRLGIDRRTVKAKVDPDMLEELRRQ